MNYVLINVKVLGFTPNTSCITPTNLTVDGCSALAQTFECLNSTHTLLMFSLVMLFTAKKEFISRKPIQGLNLNLRSISGLEPKRPVAISHFFTQHSDIPGILILSSAYQASLTFPKYPGNVHFSNNGFHFLKTCVT
jgi:hypothetical protein